MEGILKTNLTSNAEPSFVIMLEWPVLARTPGTQDPLLTRLWMPRNVLENLLQSIYTRPRDKNVKAPVYLCLG